MNAAERTRVLVLEDDPEHYRIVEDSCGDHLDLRRATRLGEAIGMARSEKFGVLLLDLHVPDSSGLETVERAVRDIPGLPIVVLTTVADDELGAKCLRAGAQDYLVKGRQPTRRDLEMRSIRYAIERHGALAAVEQERSRREGMKDEFLSHVSHELRTPLSAVHQFATILLARIPGPMNDAQQEYLEIIVRNSKQLAKMIEDILEVTRAESGKLSVRLRAVPLASVVQEVTQRTWNDAESKKIHLGVSIEPGLPRVHGDPDRLSQMLGNLVDNAIKFTPKGGSVNVRALRADAETLCVEVEDTGCGVSEENRTRIFERMHQDANTLEHSRKGLGLGLFICRELVARHGGRIWVDPGPHGGSIFRFTLPVFSLARLVGRCVLLDGALRPALTLVLLSLELGEDSDQGMLADRSDHALRELLERTLYADRDLLLPDLHAVSHGPAFTIVVSTDLAGAHALCERVKASMRVNDELSDLVEALRISFTTLTPDRELAALPPEQAVLALTARIEAAATKTA
ncbi:MAG: hybrid sensor histidine kinase/response regulator [Myxococcota bacterium]